jgi:DNA-binding SARP family transcriptional activator
MPAARGRADLGGTILRLRLLKAVSESRQVLVEAGAGFGKTVLADQHRRSLGVGAVTLRLSSRDADPALLCGTLVRSLRASRLSDLVSAVEGSQTLDEALDFLLDALAATTSPVLLVIDDAHHVIGTAAETIVERVSLDLPAQHCLMVMARAMPGTAGVAWRSAGRVRIGAAELAFTVGEVADLLRSCFGVSAPDAAASELHRASGGWPAAVVLAAALVRAADDPAAEIYRLTGRASILGWLIDDLLGALGSRERQALARLSHLPLLSDRLAEVATGLPGLLAAAGQAGLPVPEGPPGWRRFPDPVAEYLRRAAPLDLETAERAAAQYLEAGEDLTAMTTLLAGGSPSRAAEVLATLQAARLERLGPAEVRALVDSLPADIVRSHPRVLLQMARLSELGYRAVERRDALDRCRRMSAAAGDGALLREVMAEQALDMVRDGIVDEARALAGAVLSQAGEEEFSARARALDCLARLESLWYPDPAAPERTETLLRQAASIAVRAGHKAWASGLLMRLAQDVFYATCRHADAVAAADEALEVVAGRPRLRALPLIFRAEPLRELGRYDEARASADEARDLGYLYHDDRILAYAAWEDMLAAAQVGDRAGCVSAAAEVERRKGAWYEGYTGIEYLAEAADAFDRIGEAARAQAYLGEGRRRAEGEIDRDLRAAQALVMARSGDPQAGRSLVNASLADQATPLRLVWRLQLLGAYADLRRGEKDAARAAAAAVFERCARLGIPELPLVVERAAAEALVPLAAAGGSPVAAAMHDAARRATIHVLGRFDVVRAGQSVPVPPGRPATAVKAVAAHAGRLRAEELIEVLWPEGDPDAGKARLRTVLSRIRSSAGDVLVRDGDVVVTGPGVEVDALAFEAEARQSLRLARGDRRRAATVARAALARYLGPLLPEDPTADWAAGQRERLRVLHLELLDIVAAEAEREQQFDEAIRLLHEAIAVEPYDEVRYARAARLLASQGRTGSARALLTQATATLAEIGITPSFDAGRLLP